MKDEQCVICAANFRPEAMVGQKCKLCDKLYPDAETVEDIKDSNKERARLLNEPVIKEIIYEILAEAGIRRVRCEKCKRLFFKKSPAQKFCDACKSEMKAVPKESKVDDKETE